MGVSYSQNLNIYALHDSSNNKKCVSVRHNGLLIGVTKIDPYMGINIGALSHSLDHILRYIKRQETQ